MMIYFDKTLQKNIQWELSHNLRFPDKKPSK